MLLLLFQLQTSVLKSEVGGGEGEGGEGRGGEEEGGEGLMVCVCTCVYVCVGNGCVLNELMSL